MEKILQIKSGEREFKIELNDWAQRANASIAIKSGGSLTLSTIVKGDKREGIDFTPLTVDYEEKFFAAGKIYGSRFLRREGKPSETATLNARLIDRSIRPALKGFTNELQIVNTVFSIDPDNDTDLMALLGSSIAVDLMGFEWLGPIAGVKIAKANSEFVVNPKTEENAEFVIFIAGNKNKIHMIELSGNEANQSDIVKACELGRQEFEKIAKSISEFTAHFVRDREKLISPRDLFTYAEKFLAEENIDIEKSLFSKKEGEEALSDIFKKLQAKKDLLGENFANTYQGLLQKISDVFKKKIFKEKIRPDGRRLDEIRPLKAEVGILPRPHGSAIFQRGLTHILSAVTLAPPGEELWIREIEFEGTKRVMHHYNFPSYSTGETGRMGPPGRREIGHGALAEKSISKIIPPEQDFPYTIRIVSDVLSSNGSTSMGSVCASSLALLDAGVPLKNIATGISIGLVYENDDDYLLLTDIQGPEDHYGSMDFKVSSTKKGIVAIQMDVKNDGLTIKIIEEALDAAIVANRKIADFIRTIIKAPRQSFKPGVPYVKITQINPEKIGVLIGPGGKTIQEITSTTNTKIDVRQEGAVFISAEKSENLDKAKNLVKIVTGDIAVGDIVYGKVEKILAFGAIIELAPNITGLLHISEIAPRKIENIEIESEPSRSKPREGSRRNFPQQTAGNFGIKIGEILKLNIKQINPDGKIYLSLKDAGEKL